MLAYVLAWVIGLSSLGLYLAAFFFPEIHRKNDFIWSGLGLFYALVLWVYAQRITGGVLLGQTASVVLLSWLGWETLKLRRQLTPSEQQTELPSTSIQAQANLIREKLTKQLEGIVGLFTKVKNQIQATPGASRKDHSTQATQLPQTSQSPVAVRDAKETLEKDIEVVPSPAVTDEAVVQDQLPVEAAPITEKVKPEIEVSPQSSTDETVAKQDQGSAAKVTPIARSAEPKIVETEVTSRDIQVKPALTRDNLQAKFTEIQTKLADLPIRDRWNKLSELASSLFTNVKDQVQGIISTVTQRQRKPDAETTQQPVTPSTTIDSSTTQDVESSKDQAASPSASAIIMDEAVTGSTPVEDVELKIEDTALPINKAMTVPETPNDLEQPDSVVVVEEVVTEEESTPEADSVVKETDAAMPPVSLANTASVEEIATSNLSTPDAEVESPAPVEELAPEVEVAEVDSDWPPEPEPDWSSEPEPPVRMETAPPEGAVAEPEAPPPSSNSESPSEDKEQKQNPSNLP